MNPVRALIRRLVDTSTSILIATEAAKGLAELPTDDVPLSPFELARLMTEVDELADRFERISSLLVEAVAPEPAA